MQRGNMREHTNIWSRADCGNQWGSRDGDTTGEKGSHELMLHAHRPRHLEGLEKSTLGAHRVHTGLLPWSAPGTSCVALGEVQSLSPHAFIVWCIAEAAYAVRLSSAVHYTRSMAIQFPQEIYYAFIIFNEYKVGELAKGNSLAYFLLIFKIWKLKPILSDFMAVQQRL